ncbi:hypothetical protein M5689_023367 [Euphorbia peplus]|nr:hypothetical protein M5689_023367 [Euphorbia peplus]
MTPEPKKRKLNPPPFRRTASSSTGKQSRDVIPVPAPKAQGVDFRIQQAKNFAVAQAQQDGCTGNYRIFDSPFENFLIPVIPTRAELSG